jgi:uncharacterized protein (TIGR03067 family)
MLRIVCLVIVAALPLKVSADDAAKKDLDAIQGVWKVESVEVDGKQVPGLGGATILSIKGKKLLYAGEEVAELAIDPKVKPPSIDLTFAKPKRELEGIYSISGDTLKLCINRQADGVKDRPTKFETTDLPELRLLVLKRLKADTDPKAGLPAFVGIQIKLDETTKEVVIQDPIEGSPAEKAGLKKDDVVLKVNDDNATDLQTTVKVIRQAKPGTELTVRVRRGEKEMDIKVKAGYLPFYLLN